jgi:hypothetical protein
VSTIMNFMVPYNIGELLACASEEKHCSRKLLNTLKHSGYYMYHIIN